MPESIERIMNLALLLSGSRRSYTAEEIRLQVEGYPSALEQKDVAFKRMFERDKELLLEAGFVIECDLEGRYRLDNEATFSPEIPLNAKDRIFLARIGNSLLCDESFPLRDDLRQALLKIDIGSQEFMPTPPECDATVLETSRHVDLLFKAVSTKKHVSFDYSSQNGQRRRRDVEPYGLYAIAGRWYLVGRDSGVNETRTYAVHKIEALSVNSARPKNPDFDLSDTFCISDYVRHPFHFGGDDFEARIFIAPEHSWRVPSLTAGNGSIEWLNDGGCLWETEAANRRRLARWIIENGPGISLISPVDLREEIAARLKAVASMHGAAD